MKDGKDANEGKNSGDSADPTSSQKVDVADEEGDATRHETRGQQDETGDQMKEQQAAEASQAEDHAKDEQFVKIVNERDQLKAEVDEGKKKILRLLADLENVRSIARRDVESSRKFAVQSFAKSLLDVADNLERAIASVPPEEKDSEKNPQLCILLEGVEMTQAELTKAFAKNGLEKYGKAGERFDPNMHNAMFEYEDTEMEAGTIGQVLKPGYKLHDRIIRPAQVGTIKG